MVSLNLGSPQNQTGGKFQKLVSKSGVGIFVNQEQ